MSLKKDVIGAEVQIGSNEAQKSLVDLAQKTATLTNENDRLRISQAKLKALGKGSEEEYKKVTSAITENNKAIKENKSQMDALRKTIGLTDMSFPQLRKRAAELRKELLDMGDSADKVQFDKLNSELVATERQMGKLKGRIGETKSEINPLINTAKGLLPAFGFAALLAGAKSLFTNIISVRREFEKYEAILTNTLGSNKAARKEMQMLAEIAAKTPFSLNDLTGSFVKLTNYGLKPSRAELIKYGDLASSVGKGIDQLVEGVSDAVTGEFERLKEFGIKAKKEGDKITFTFKEQSVVVDNNTQAIKNYILSLGDLQGVAGSMAAIAETLDGRISNIGDAWDRVMNKMGEGSSGVMVPALEGLTSDLDDWSKLFDIWADDRISKWEGFLASFSQVQMDKIWNKLENERFVESMLDVKQEESTTDGSSSDPKKIEEKRKLTEKARKEADDKAAKAKKDATQQALSAIDLAHAGELLRLKQYYSDKENLDKEYKARLLASELAYLRTKESLEPDQLKKIELQSQIIDKQHEYTAALKAAVPEIIATRDGIDKLNGRLLEEAKLLNLAAKTQAKGAADQDAYTAKQLQQADTIKMVGDVMTDYVTGALNGSIDEYQTFGDTLILMSMQMLKMMVPIWSAQILGLSLSSPESVASWGVAGMAKFEVVTGLMYAGISAVEGMVKSGIDKRKASASGSKQSGGFAETAASDSTPVGTYHANEFIGSAPSARNPSIRQVYNIIDLAQKQGRVATLNLPAVMASMGMLPNGRQSGGFAASSNTELVSGSNTIIQSSRDPELTEAMNNMTKAAALLMKRGVSFPMVSGIKKMREVEDLLNQTGMGGFGK